MASSTCSNFGPSLLLWKCHVEDNQSCPSVWKLRWASVTETRDALWVLTLRPGPPARTVTFCMFEVPFRVPIHLSSWIHTSQVLFPCSLEGRMHAPRHWKRGDETMHSDSSVKHKKWLLAVADAAGRSCPVQPPKDLNTSLIDTKKETHIGEIYTLNSKWFMAFSVFMFLVSMSCFILVQFTGAQLCNVQNNNSDALHK